ncbi:hypothetical protein EDD22DRAFT_978677 [Suillus occidentalis]|nr:hypothetical protein EDD22DRAFT_978677 [Suillus occidentalis]
MDYNYGNDAIDDNMALGVSGNVDEVYRDYHLELDGHICDAVGNFVPMDTIPPPLTLKQPGDWTPYRSRLEFETTEFLYKKVQMSAGDIDKLMHLWGLDHWDLYSTIDETPIGDVAWQSFSMKYGVDADPASDLTPWMDATYTTWFCDPHTIIRNMLGNPDFKNEMDYVPYHEWKGQGESATRQWRNVMSGDWAWDQADEIAKDPATHGSTFVPVILRSDKTTVSVATGQNDYYPLYASIRNVHNNVRSVIGFLAIPKTTKKHSDDPCFRKFKKQLFHSSLSRILSSLKPAMSVPEVVQFGDGHFRRVVYGLGPYIADYPEQLVLGCVVQNWCAKCFAYPDNLDSGEGGLRSREVVDTLCDEVDAGVLWEEWGVISDVVLLAPDILHQVIKGAFKDHLVAWVKKHAKAILDDIDHRIAAAPPFAGLRRFPQGHGFSQWTGDDSKALMKVYLPAIEGHVPQDIIRCFRAFLEFCYIMRQDIIAEDTLLQLSDCLGRFHRYRQIFQDTSIRFDGFSLPRQHALCHYSMLIRLFGAPNGICSSITESKHIKAVKEHWRRSSKFNALGQMLLTNQRLDKLAASRSDFTACRMLDDLFINPADQADSECPHLDEPGDGIIEGPRAQCNVKLARTHQRYRARNIRALADELHIPDLPRLVQLFLFDQLLADDVHTSDTVPLSACPRFEGRIKIFNSATASFYAPSDPSGVGGMRHEHIRAAPSWCRGPAPRMGSMGWTSVVSCVFFHSSTVERLSLVPLVHWFKLIVNEPNPDTGIACHLLPIFDSDFAPDNLTLHNVLDIWPSFYVNRFVDHHAFEIAY